MTANDSRDKIIASDLRLTELAPIAEMGYTNWPYHSYEHAGNTLVAAWKLADQCESKGEDINRPVLVAATLFHDYLYAQPLSEEQFATKEERSAYWARYFMKGMDFSETDVELASRCILATEPDGTNQSLEETVMVRADLDSALGDFPWFLVNFSRIAKEAVMTSKMQVSLDFSAIYDTQAKILRRYVKRDLSLPGDRISPVEKVEDNLRNLRKIGEKALNGIVRD